MIVSFKMVFLSFVILAFLNPPSVKAAADDDDKEADRHKPKRRTLLETKNRAVLGDIGNDMAFVMTNSQPQEELSQKDLKDMLAVPKLTRTVSEAPNSTNGDDTTF